MSGNIKNPLRDYGPLFSVLGRLVFIYLFVFKLILCKWFCAGREWFVPFSSLKPAIDYYIYPSHDEKGNEIDFYLTKANGAKIIPLR